MPSSSCQFPTHSASHRGRATSGPEMRRISADQWRRTFWHHIQESRVWSSTPETEVVRCHIASKTSTFARKSFTFASRTPRAHVKLYVRTRISMWARGRKRNWGMAVTGHRKSRGRSSFILLMLLSIGFGNSYLRVFQKDYKGSEARFDSQ